MHPVLKFITEYAPYMIAFLVIVINLMTSIHALFYKRDARATVSWVGFIWLVPLTGAVLYVLFGINRIRRRAKLLRTSDYHRTQYQTAFICSDDAVLPGVRSLKRLADNITAYPLVRGNSIEIFENGDEAFPAMLDAIARAEESITLAIYIFDNDLAGKDFLRALTAAHKRGVAVRVLLDDIGVRYSFPTMFRELRRAGVPVARFLPTIFTPRFAYLNLRNHRKIMVVDGRIGFTGGMNIRIGNCLKQKPKHPIRDLMAKLEGPVVAQIQSVFADDWYFSTSEKIAVSLFFPKLLECGKSIARGIADGPDENLYVLRNVLMTALAKARHHVQIVTPYFVPDESLITALGVTALRGVKVDIIIPENGNLSLVQWAMMGNLWPILEMNCNVWLSPEPFDHTKLMVVDQEWTLFGSTNWDTRSLRLNFEFNIECYDVDVAVQASQIIEAKRAQSRAYSLSDMHQKSFLLRLRDGIARLFIPYL